MLNKKRIQLTHTDRNLEVAELLENKQYVALCGPTGAGKTSTLRFLALKAARSGQIPLFVDLATYQPGSLERILRLSLEERVRKRVHPSLVKNILSEPAALILIDGVTELPIAERECFQKDFIEFRLKYPHLQVIVAGRRPESLRRLQLPVYLLDAPDSDKKAEIVQRHLDAVGGLSKHALRTTKDLDRSLGHIIDLPLFLVMSLSISLRTETPSSRVEIYDAFLDGLWERHPREVDYDAVVCVLGCVSYDLVEEERKKTPRYWWLQRGKEILQEFVDSFSPRSSESIIEAAEQVGILEKAKLSGYAGLLHDSFLDYLAALAISREYRSLPGILSAKWEDTLAFTADRNGVSSSLAIKALEENLILAIRLASFERSDSDQISIPAIMKLLNILLNRHVGKLTGEKLGIGSHPGVMLFYGEKRLYATLLPDGGCFVVSETEAFDAVVCQGIVTVSLDRTCGPLRIILTIWYVLIEDALKKEPDKARPLKSRTLKTDLKEAIETHFSRRNSALDLLTSTWLPSISQRLIDEIGWSGLEGYLLPPLQEPYSDKVYHPFLFRYVDTHIWIHEVETTPADGRSLFSTTHYHTSAETFIERDPEQEALEELQKRFLVLRPGRTDQVKR